MSIKMKILVPMLALTILAATVTLCSNIVQFSNYVDTAAADGLDMAAAVVINEFEMLKTYSNTASLYIAEDLTIIEAIEKGDRNALLERSKQIQAETGVEFCTIANAEGKVLIRSHEPERYGDDITSQANVRAALSGHNLTAVEQGTAVRLSIHSGAPVYDGQGRLLGVVSVGYRLDTDMFVDKMKSLLNYEVTIFSNDERISTTVVKEDGTRAVGTKAAENVSQTVLAGNSYMGQARILNQDALTKYTPIFGPDGSVLGMLFVGRYLNEKTDTVWSFVQMGLLIALILLAGCLPVVLLIAKRITAPIKTMVRVAHALAAGDTEVNVRVKTGDEVGELADAFNSMIENTQRQVQLIEDIAAGDLTVEIRQRGEQDVMNASLKKMTDNLRHMFGDIQSAATQVSIGSKQIADGAQALAQGSTEQASAIETLSISIGEISSKTKQNADIAREASELSGVIKVGTEEGSAQMDRMMRAVEEINDASSQIGKIMKVIDDIAFQTNILALNAAVEAARAGQHGKGFAVVAEEVRSLAAKSAEAAKNTGGLIEASIKKADLGLGIATETAASLEKIVDGINRSADIVLQIARSSEEQAEAIAQVNTGIEKVALVVQQNSATAEESAAASEEMSGQSNTLEQLISQFKLENAEPPPSLRGSSIRMITAPGEGNFSFEESVGECGKY